MSPLNASVQLALDRRQPQGLEKRDAGTLHPERRERSYGQSGGNDGKMVIGLGGEDGNWAGEKRERHVLQKHLGP